MLRVVVPVLTPEGGEVVEASLEVSEEATLLLAATFIDRNTRITSQSIDVQGHLFGKEDLEAGLTEPKAEYKAADVYVEHCEEDGIDG